MKNLWMLGMTGTGMGIMGTGMMRGGMTCCAGMSAWALIWMLLLAAAILAAIVLLVRSVSRS